jgi:hypothetical protein
VYTKHYETLYCSWPGTIISNQWHHAKFLTCTNHTPTISYYEARNHEHQFNVCKSVHHRTIQINHQPDATVFQFIILMFIYSSTCFGPFLTHHQELNDCSGSLWFYLRIMVIVLSCSWSGWPARPTTNKTGQALRVPEG